MSVHKRIKIAYIITGLSTGGAEKMLYKLLQHMDRDRFAIHVISLTTKGEVGIDIEALGIPVYSLDIRANPLALLKFIQLVWQLQKRQPDIVHTWMYHADLLGGLAARLAGKKKVLWCIRNSGPSQHNTKRTTLFVVKVCAKFSHWLPQSIISCSQKAQDVHKNLGYCANKFTVVPNGFDLRAYKPDTQIGSAMRAELNIPSDALLVGLFARYHPQKNQVGFVDAVAKVIRVIPNVRVLMVGSNIDWQNAQLAFAIEKTGYQTHFHLLGLRDDIPKLINTLDIYVSSSWGEAFPNVLGEAMACGVPCVATDVGDSAHIVGDTGLIVEAGDMDGLAQAIIGVLGNHDVRIQMGKCARHRMQKYYEISAITQQYQDFYLSVVAAG